jgi:hypothetical protein
MLALKLVSGFDCGYRAIAETNLKASAGNAFYHGAASAQ